MHWRNSNFQTVAFIIGKCHTADEAYRKLQLQILDRRKAIDAALISQKRAALATSKAQAVLRNFEASDDDKAEALITLEEIGQETASLRPILEEAQREELFMVRLAEYLLPFRKYKDLPDHEAFQLIQREEWCLELIHRAQNFLYCSGTIPTDHFDTMRAHPDFRTIIAPAVDAMQEAVRARNLEKLSTFTIQPAFKTALMNDGLLGPAPELSALPASSIKFLGR